MKSEEAVVEIATLLNTVIGIASGAGIPLIGLAGTIAKNFSRGSEISPEEIQDSIQKAEESLASLKAAIAARR